MALRDSFIEEVDIEEEGVIIPPVPPVDVDEIDMIAAKEGEAEATFDQAMVEAAPEGDFSGPTVQILVDSVNAVLPLFGEDAVLVGEIAEDIEIFPNDLTASISMISQAAQDAMLEEYAPLLSEIQADEDIIRIAVQIDALGELREFKMFLGAGGPAPEEEIVEEQTLEIPSPFGGEEIIEDEEVEELFRARRI